LIKPGKFPGFFIERDGSQKVFLNLSIIFGTTRAYPVKTGGAKPWVYNHRGGGHDRQAAETGTDFLQYRRLMKRRSPVTGLR
jgi:hypothetical protein